MFNETNRADDQATGLPGYLDPDEINLPPERFTYDDETVLMVRFETEFVGPEEYVTTVFASSIQLMERPVFAVYNDAGRVMNKLYSIVDTDEVTTAREAWTALVPHIHEYDKAVEAGGGSWVRGHALQSLQTSIRKGA